MSDERRRYVIGLGANLGDRRATLQSAVAALARLARIVRVSGLYETAAVGPPQPDYLNAAVLLESELHPLGLLEQLLMIERRHGRERRERWGPRTLDLDLLYSPQAALSTPELTLPHRELPHRPFALLPLVDVLPEARDPESGRLYAQLLPALECSGVRHVESAASWCAGRTE